MLWGDGIQARDFTHVDNIVRGLEQMADHELTGVYNLGTGDPYSFNEMVRMINDELGTHVEPEYEPVPLENYVYHTCADISKITDATGRTPQIDFEDGLKRVCQPHLD